MSLEELTKEESKHFTDTTTTSNALDREEQKVDRELAKAQTELTSLTCECAQLQQNNEVFKSQVSELDMHLGRLQQESHIDRQQCRYTHIETVIILSLILVEDIVTAGPILDGNTEKFVGWIHQFNNTTTDTSCLALDIGKQVHVV